MNNKKIFITYCIFACITWITIFVSIVLNRNEVLQKDYVPYMENWVDDKGDAAEFSKISGPYKITNTLPDFKEDCVLFFNIKSANVSVYKEDVCVYETPEHEERLSGKTPGSYFVQVELSKEDSGKEITLFIDNPYNDAAGKITEMYIGNGTDILKNDLALRIPGFCISLIITFMGFFFIIIFIPLWRNKSVGMEMLYFGLFAFVIGLFMLTDCKFFQEFFGNSHHFHMISEMAMMFIIIPLLMYLEEMYREYQTQKRIFLGVYIYSLLNFVICFALNVMGLFDYHETVWITHLSYVAAVTVLLVCLIRNIRRGYKGNVFHNIGIACICIAVVVDIVMLQIGTSLETTFFTRIGVLGFMCLESAQIIWRVVLRYRENIKAQILEKLAYQDGLTELLNRTSFMEDMKTLEEEKSSDVLVAMFDVNDLKFVNDTYGHAHGDEMLKKVAEQMKEYLLSLGKCYRIGGDEFVFVAWGNRTEDTFIKNNSKMQKSLKRLNESKTLPYRITVAFGYAIWDHSGNESLEEVIERADANMYKNKKAMKESFSKK